MLTLQYSNGNRHLFFTCSPIQQLSFQLFRLLSTRSYLFPMRTICFSVWVYGRCQWNGQESSWVDGKKGTVEEEKKCVCGNENKSSASTTSESAQEEVHLYLWWSAGGQDARCWECQWNWYDKDAVRGRSIDSLVAAPPAPPFVAMARLEHTWLAFEPQSSAVWLIIITSALGSCGSSFQCREKCSQVRMRRHLLIGAYRHRTAISGQNCTERPSNWLHDHIAKSHASFGRHMAH